MSFGTTILSRFDAIFLLKDVIDNEADNAMAKHVLRVHTAGTGANPKEESTAPDADGVVPVETLRRFVQYARQKIRPVMQKQAPEKRTRFYVDTRKKVKSLEGLMKEKSPIPNNSQTAGGYNTHK